MVVPSVAQQLAAIRHTIAKTVLPALADDADFEREQAGLVLASLDWAIDVVDSEHRYETVEHADQRALLADLLAVAPEHAEGGGDGAGDGGDDEARAALDAAASPPADLAGLRAQTRALKVSTDRVFTALRARSEGGTGDGADAGARAHALLAGAAARQTVRELAWTRMTGFPRGAPAIADVLAEQAEQSEQSDAGG